MVVHLQHHLNINPALDKSNNHYLALVNKLSNNLLAGSYHHLS